MTQDGIFAGLVEVSTLARLRRAIVGLTAVAAGTFVRELAVRKLVH